MTIRITGLNSGLDTDSIIKELVSAYRSKGDKIKKQQTKLSWTQDKWKSLNAKVLNLYKSLDSLRFSTGYNMKKTTVSDTTKATVTAGKDAVNGTQTLSIQETAKGGYLTGDQLKKNKKGSSATLGYLDSSFSGSGTIRISGNGVNKDIVLKDTDTIDSFLKEINNSGTGVTASYDANNQRIFITSKETGKENDFTLIGMDQNGSKALSALGVNVKSSTATAEADAWKEYYQGGVVDTAKLQNDVEALVQAKKDMADTNENIKNKQADNSKLNSAVKYANSYSDMMAVVEKNNMGRDNASQLSKLANLSDADLEKQYVVDANGNFAVDQDGKFIEATADQIAAGDAEKGADAYARLMTGIDRYENQKDKDGNDVLDKNGNPVQVETKIYKQIKAYDSNLKAVDAYEAEPANSYKLPSGTTSADAALVSKGYSQMIEDNNADIEQYSDDLLDLADKIDSYHILDGANVTKDMTAAEITDYVQKLSERVKYFAEDYGNSQFNTGANKVDATDAEIYLNGAYFTSSTNTFNINGLTIQAQAKTTDDIMITTATDTQGLYDKIKDFISEYNSIINEMSTLYNAPSSKGYEPLTSEEKEALSDSDVAEWEKKVKDSLLRRDSNLSTLMNVMTSAMSATYEVNGKKYSLSSLGIKTGSYFTTTAANRYELHIDGDTDDDTVSANADKLMTMLNSDPDTVIGIIQSAASKLSEDLGKQMKSSSLRSFQSIYNDKSMAQSYSDYTKKITAWEEKVTAIEDSYYKKFAAMETALAKLQSQQSAFAGLLGNS